MSFLDRKKKEEKGPHIVVIREPEEFACGGTTETRDINAPKEIISRDLRYFCATSALGRGPDPDCPFYISAFAEKGDLGSFVLLEVREDFTRRDTVKTFAYLKEDIFPDLDSLVRELDLVKNNGNYHRTHGLPENFGGSVEAVYESGEKISFSDNQSPVLTKNGALAIKEFFAKALKGEKVHMPEVEDLREIRFEELRKNGGFTRAALTINPDGTGLSKKESRYDDPKIYESEKPVDAETVAAIKADIKDNAMFCWETLPDSGVKQMLGRNKSMTFIMKDGKEIWISDARNVPDQIERGFFNIELEMTTKH